MHRAPSTNTQMLPFAVLCRTLAAEGHRQKLNDCRTQVSTHHRLPLSAASPWLAQCAPVYDRRGAFPNPVRFPDLVKGDSRSRIFPLQISPEKRSSRGMAGPLTAPCGIHPAAPGDGVVRQMHDPAGHGRRSRGGVEREDVRLCNSAEKAAFLRPYAGRAGRIRSLP